MPRAVAYLRMLGMVAFLGACLPSDGRTGLDIGFLAFITDFEVAPGVSPGDRWMLEIHETSGTVGGDTTIVIEPRDTVIFEAQVATYRVRLHGLPIACRSRDPIERFALLPEPQRTITMRYRVVCSSVVAIRTITLGQPSDDAYVYAIRGPGGTHRSGLALPNDTVRIDDIEPGAYDVELGHVAENCVIVSNHGDVQPLEVPEQSQRVTSIVLFNVICSEPSYRPEITHVGATRDGSRTVFTFEAFDPGAEGIVSQPDIDEYVWDVTNCDRGSIVEGGEVRRTGLSGVGARNRHADTVRVVAVIERALVRPSPACVSLRVQDADGNTTQVVEERLGQPMGSPPRIDHFQATIVGTDLDRSVRFELEGSDPDGDLVGSYVQVLMRDGRVLGRGIEGHLGLAVPDLSLTAGALSEGDIQGFRVFLVDREGAAAVAQDLDPVG